MSENLKEDAVLLNMDVVLKTAFRGYDRDDVQKYILDMMNANQQEKDGLSATIEDLRKQNESLKRDVNESVEKYNELLLNGDPRLHDLLDQKNDEIAELQEKIAAMEFVNESEDGTEENKSVDPFEFNDTISSLQATVSSYGHDHEELEALKEENNALKERLNELMNAEPENTVSEEEYNAVKEELESLKQENTDLKVEILGGSETEETIQKLQESLNTAEQEKKTLQTAMDEKDEVIAELRASAEEYEKANAERTEESTEVEKAFSEQEAELSDTKLQLAEKDQVISDLNASVADLEKKLEELKVSCSDRNAVSENMQTKLNELQEENRKLAEEVQLAKETPKTTVREELLARQLSEKEHELSIQNEKLNSLKNQFRHLNDQVTTLQARHEKLVRESRVLKENAEYERAGFQKKLDEYRDACGEGDLRSIRSELDGKERELSDLRDRLASETAKTEAMRETVDHLHERNEELLSREADYEKKVWDLQSEVDKQTGYNTSLKSELEKLYDDKLTLLEKVFDFKQAMEKKVR